MDIQAAFTLLETRPGTETHKYSFQVTFEIILMSFFILKILSNSISVYILSSLELRLQIIRKNEHVIFFSKYL